jgi:serine/threonine protein phosphatase PrpC
MKVRAFGATDTGLVRSHNEDAFVVLAFGSKELAAAGVAPVSAPSSAPAPETVKTGSVPPPRATPIATPVAGTPAFDSVILGDTAGPGVVLVVSDGMGGAQAGEVASGIVIDRLREAMRAFAGTAPSGEEMRDAALRRVVQEVSHHVRLAARAPDKKGMGATLTMAWLQNQTAVFAQVGDSRGYLLRGGKLQQVTHDQSFVQMLVDSGALTAEAAEASPQKNVIMQVMGQEDELDVVLGRITLTEGDRLLLCSDGLSNMVETEDLPKLVGLSPLERACSALVEAAKEGGGEDNITAVVAEIGG